MRVQSQETDRMAVLSLVSTLYSRSSFPFPCPTFPCLSSSFFIPLSPFLCPSSPLLASRLVSSRRSPWRPWRCALDCLHGGKLRRAKRILHLFLKSLRRTSGNSAQRKVGDERLGIEGKALGNKLRANHGGEARQRLGALFQTHPHNARAIPGVEGSCLAEGQLKRPYPGASAAQGDSRFLGAFGACLA